MSLDVTQPIHRENEIISIESRGKSALTISADTGGGLHLKPHIRGVKTCTNKWRGGTF